MSNPESLFRNISQILLTHPDCLFLQITPVVLDTVGVGQTCEEPDLLQDVLPLLQGLLPAVGHLLDGHHLVGDVLPGVVDGPEGPVANLPEVIEYLIRVFSLKQLGDLGVLEGPGSGCGRHCWVVFGGSEVNWSRVLSPYYYCDW